MKMLNVSLLFVTLVANGFPIPSFLFELVCDELHEAMDRYTDTTGKKTEQLVSHKFCINDERGTPYTPVHLLALNCKDYYDDPDLYEHKGRLLLDADADIHRTVRSGPHKGKTAADIVREQPRSTCQAFFRMLLAHEQRTTSSRE